MMNGCHCDDGLGHGIMNEMAWTQYLSNDPDPGDAYGDGDYYFRLGTEGLGMTYGGLLTTEGLGFALPDVGGGDGGGGIWPWPGITLGGTANPPTIPLQTSIDCATNPDLCQITGSGPVPASGPPIDGGGGTPIDWGSIIGSLITTGGRVAGQAVTSGGYGSYQITGYTPQGQPIYGGASGQLALGRGGVTGQLGISTNTLMLIAGGVLIYLVASGRRR